MAETPNTIVSFTPEEVVLVTEMINSVNIPGKLVEQVVEIKRKLRESQSPSPETS